jgi:hypothetical protein
MDAKTTNQQRHDASPAETCARTQTRTEACACGACARSKSSDAKHRANKRDVLALLDLIAGCVDCHPSQPHGDATWGHVGDIAHLRGRLMEIATRFALGPDGDEQAARRRLEEALCAEDEHVGEALIDAM